MVSNDQGKRAAESGSGLGAELGGTGTEKMDNEQLDIAILARFPNLKRDEDVPMPSTSWTDGGPLIEEQELSIDRSYASGGWDGKGSVWRAHWRGPNGELAEGIGPTILVASMLAILRKTPNFK